MTTIDLLLDAVRTATGTPGLVYASEPAVLSGGFHAEMYKVRFAGAPAGLDGELVARISPEAHSARRDAAVQGAVAELGFPTARVRLTIGDDSVLVFDSAVRRATTTPFVTAWPEVEDEMRPEIARMFYDPVLDLDTLLPRLDARSQELMAPVTEPSS